MAHADLPQPGTGSKLTCRASDVEITLRSKPVVVDFTGTCVLTAETDSPDAVRLTGLRLVANLPDAGGPEDGGTVTLEQDDVEADGVLRPLRDSPSRFANDLVITLGATVDQPDGVVRAVAGNAVEFSTAGASSPSATGHYELLEPVDLVLPDNSEVTIAHIDSLVLQLDSA
ncbi:hypothetical protein ACFFQW_26655 [Umezawaea endophytica]|uniref:Uncharacterized protein n=1 Tax=Umezawaea endophytica TaxID=1654476 RepID=A0A9X2VLZ3_9PSEU|nr:hypothetical protein [Umezawaea endophytica]MCS7477638.1 hypothetical protein [Umezawaea endophytica]